MSHDGERMVPATESGRDFKAESSRISKNALATLEQADNGGEVRIMVRSGRNLVGPRNTSFFVRIFCGTRMMGATEEVELSPNPTFREEEFRFDINIYENVVLRTYVRNESNEDREIGEVTLSLPDMLSGVDTDYSLSPCAGVKSTNLGFLVVSAKITLRGSNVTTVDSTLKELSRTHQVKVPNYEATRDAKSMNVDDMKNTSARAREQARAAVEEALSALRETAVASDVVESKAHSADSAPSPESSQMSEGEPVTSGGPELFVDVQSALSDLFQALAHPWNEGDADNSSS